MEKSNIWIRIAGNATNIKANHPHGWRCYFKGESHEISLKDWSVSGIASLKNFVPGFSANKDEYGFVAWIDCFGNGKVENEVLHINLKEPTA